MAQAPDITTLTSAYGQLFGMLLESPGVEEFLDEAARLAPEIVTSAAACGITFRRRGTPFTVAYSHRLAAEIDELQYGADEGPCLEAMRAGHTVEVIDLPQDTRWDGWRPHALAHGLGSSLSMPLAVDGADVGAMNLYGTRPRAFTADDRQHGEAFAAHASAALTLALRQAQHDALRVQMTEAMASRSIIDQAIGILMGQQRCDAARAFDVLRRASQHRNRKLRDVAAEIIVTVSGGPPTPPHFR